MVKDISVSSILFVTCKIIFKLCLKTLKAKSVIFLIKTLLVKNSFNQQIIRHRKQNIPSSYVKLIKPFIVKN